MCLFSCTTRPHLNLLQPFLPLTTPVLIPTNLTSSDIPTSTCSAAAAHATAATTAAATSLLLLLLGCATRATWRLDHIKGCDEAKDELQELVQLLKQPDRLAAMSAHTPKGMLLVGQPGGP